MTMKQIYGILFLLVLCMCSCSSSKTNKNDNSIIIENLKEANLKTLVGKKTTIIGKTVNVKGGAILLVGNEIDIWMDEMDSWPDGYYNSETEAKTIKVTGILIERNDLPIYIHNEKNSIYQQGIPMPKGTNLKKANHRYLLKNYKWIVLD
jgi:hypothetical protein